jgi:excisionase family DNA binding protein
MGVWSMSITPTLPMLKNLSKFLTIGQAAKKAEVSRTTILNDIKNHKLKAQWNGKHGIIQKEDFIEYIKEKSHIEKITAFLNKAKNVFFFTPRELMELFGVVYTTIRRWITHYFYFTVTRICGRLYISRSSVEKFIYSNPKKLLYQR